MMATIKNAEKEVRQNIIYSNYYKIPYKKNYFDLVIGFSSIYKYNIKGVGPGEVMLYFLLNNGHLGGGSSAGVDIVDAAGSFEV